jgi:hypothetical protein
VDQVRDQIWDQVCEKVNLEVIHRSLSQKIKLVSVTLEEWEKNLF